MKHPYFMRLMCLMCLMGNLASPVSAQTPRPQKNPISELTDLATDSALFASEAAKLSSPSAQELEELSAAQKEDITRPEEPTERGEFFELFSRRPASVPSMTNFLAYTVQYAVAEGLPANT